jgi:hypothetical protein
VDDVGNGAPASKKTKMLRPSDTLDSVDDIGNSALATKKNKTLRPSDTLDSDDFGMHADVQVMDIDDATDPREETLNATSRTADITFFFIPIASAPNTPARVKCKLCE